MREGASRAGLGALGTLWQGRAGRFARVLFGTEFQGRIGHSSRLRAGGGRHKAQTLCSFGGWLWEVWRMAPKLTAGMGACANVLNSGCGFRWGEILHRDGHIGGRAPGFGIAKQKGGTSCATRIAPAAWFPTGVSRILFF